MVHNDGGSSNDLNIFAFVHSLKNALCLFEWLLVLYQLQSHLVCLPHFQKFSGA